jgi:hypothetical protein
VIPRHQFRGREHRHMTIAHHCGVGGGQGFEGLYGALRPLLLDKADHGVEDDDGDDGDGVYGLADEP